MRGILRLLLPALAAVLVTGAAAAASLFDVTVWMRAVDQRSVSVQRHIQRGDAQAAIADARELASLYQRMEGFFLKEPNAADAARMSREAQEHAERVLASLTQNKFDDAAQAVLGITRACHDCHDLYKPYR